MDNKDLIWLSKAISKGSRDFRQFTKIITVNNGMAMTTDGTRIHIVDGVNLQDGEYSRDGYFIRPFEGDNPLSRSNPLGRLSPAEEGEVRLEVYPYYLNLLRLNATYGINRKYFDQATDKVKSINLSGNLDRIVIRYDNRMAIIMGAKL